MARITIIDTLWRTLGFILVTLLCVPFVTTNAAADGLSFTEQCPALLKEADAFARDCIAKARTRSYETVTDVAGHMITVSGTTYFRPTNPGSHFSLGCVVNQKDKSTIDYFGIYYATKGSNFALADTDKAEWRDVTMSGDVGLISHGEPLNLVLVRPFVNGPMPLKNWSIWMRHLMVDNGRVTNCQDVSLPKGAIIDNFSHIKRVEDPQHIRIETCYGPGCDAQQFKRYEDLVNTKTHFYPLIGEDAFSGPFNYFRFFDSNDHEIIYANATFFIESGGSVLVRDDILHHECGTFPYFMRASRMGNFTVPNIGQEVCQLPHTPN